MTFYDRVVPEKVWSLDYYHKLRDELPSNHYVNKISYDLYLKAWSEHDAIHYLFSLSFDEYGEKRAAFVETYFNLGWSHLGLNAFAKTRKSLEIPKNFNRLKILETAEDLRSIY